MKPNFPFENVLNLLTHTKNCPASADFHKLVPKKDCVGWIDQFQFILAHRYPLVRNPEGKISFVNTAKKWITMTETWDGTSKSDVITPDEIRAMVRFLRIVSRGTIHSASVTPAYSLSCKKYNASVPLIPAAFKMYQNVGYAEWDWDEPYDSIATLVDTDICDYVKSRELWIEFVDYPFASELRECNDGGNRNSHKLNTGIMGKVVEEKTPLLKEKFVELTKASKLATQSALGSWVFNPDTPNKYSLRDLDNPDSSLYPEEAEFFIGTEKDTAPRVKLAKVRSAPTVDHGLF